MSEMDAESPVSLLAIPAVPDSYYSFLCQYRTIAVRVLVTFCVVFVLFCAHYTAEFMYYKYCRRTILHVLFWRKSNFCVSLERLLNGVEGTFDKLLEQSLVSCLNWMSLNWVKWIKI